MGALSRFLCLCPAQVNNFFRNALEGRYNTVEHWTSDARRTYGHKPFSSNNPTISSFTIKDKKGELKLYLEQQGMKGLHLSEEAVFHVQVSYARGDANAAFDLSPHQVQKARAFRVYPITDTSLTTSFRLRVSTVRRWLS